MGSILSFFRFVPDAVSKIIVSRKSELLKTLISLKLITAFIALLALILLTVFSQFVIRFFLGTDWLLPWWISITFGAQELARGAFQLAQNQRLAMLPNHRSNLPTYLLGVNLTLAVILCSFLGLIGVPLGFLIGYCFSLVLIVKGHENA
jgi:O-antigen/teichoic acid export membrane protein